MCILCIRKRIDRSGRVATTDSFCNPTISSPSLNHGTWPPPRNLSQIRLSPQNGIPLRVVAFLSLQRHESSASCSPALLPRRPVVHPTFWELPTIPTEEYLKNLPFSAGLVGFVLELIKDLVGSRIVRIVRTPRIPTDSELTVQCIERG
jgi:hypothetical protein